MKKEQGIPLRHEYFEPPDGTGCTSGVSTRRSKATLASADASNGVATSRVPFYKEPRLTRSSPPEYFGAGSREIFRADSADSLDWPPDGPANIPANNPARNSAGNVKFRARSDTHQRKKTRGASPPPLLLPRKLPPATRSCLILNIALHFTEHAPRRVYLRSK